MKFLIEERVSWKREGNYVSSIYRYSILGKEITNQHVRKVLHKYFRWHYVWITHKRLVKYPSIVYRKVMMKHYGRRVKQVKAGHFGMSDAPINELWR